MLIAFQDADDIWHREKLARQIERFRRRPELEISVTGIQNFWEPDLLPDDHRYQDERNRAPWQGYCCPTMLARRETFERVGRFNPSLQVASDDEWFIRATTEHGVVIELLPGVLVRRRMHRSNLTLNPAAQEPVFVFSPSRSRSTDAGGLRHDDELFRPRADLVSCIVPVFNGERYLAEALDSILEQSYQPIEVIVADDGSTDGTAKVAAGYGEQVRHVYQPHKPADCPRRGISD